MTAEARDGELVWAILAGDLERVKANVDQINTRYTKMGVYHNMPPLYVALLPDVQNQMSAEDHAEMISLLVRHSNTYLTSSDNYLVHLAAYGPVDLLESQLKGIIGNTQDSERLAGFPDHEFPVLSVQRGQSLYQKYGRTGDVCPLHMHVFYSYLSAPKGSAQLEQARRKLALLLDPYEYSRKYKAPMAISPSVTVDDMDISKADQRAALDTLQWLKNQKTEAENEANARAKAEQLRKAEQQRAEFARVNHPETAYFAAMKLNLDASCTFNSDAPGSFLKDVPLLESTNPRLYTELARANVHPELRERLQDIVGTMQAMGRFDEEYYNYIVDRLRDNYALLVRHDAEQRRQRTLAAFGYDRAELDRLEAESLAYAEQMNRNAWTSALSNGLSAINRDIQNSPENQRKELERRAGEEAARISRERIMNGGNGLPDSYEMKNGMYILTAGTLEQKPDDPPSGTRSGSYTKKADKGPSNACEGFNAGEYEAQVGRTCALMNPCHPGHDAWLASLPPSDGKAPGAICN